VLPKTTALWLDFWGDKSVSKNAEKRLAILYTNAWVHALGSHPGACRQDWLQLQQLQDQVPLFAQLLRNPLIKKTEWERLLTPLFAQLSLHALTKAWLLQLVHRGRIALLPACLAAAGPLLDRASGQKTAVVTSAHPISAETQVSIAGRLTGWLGLETPPKIVWAIDPRVLGGFRCMVDSLLLDFSAETKLNSMKHQLSATIATA
jgi:F-type H+-transporting ATPase subunit delta